MSMEDWYLEKACEHYKNKEFEEAEKLFSKVAEGTGKENLKVKALCFKAVSLYELGIQYENKQNFEEAKQKFDEAQEVFEKIEEKCSLEPDLKGQCCYKKGLLLYHIKDYKGAKNAFFNTISNAIDPETLANAYYYRALARELCFRDEEHLLKETIEDLEKALEQSQRISNHKDKVFFQLRLASDYLKKCKKDLTQESNDDRKQLVEKIIRDLKEALDLSQNIQDETGQISFQLGLAYYNLYKYEKKPEYLKVSLKNIKEAINNSYYEVETLDEIVDDLENTFEKGFLLYHLKRYEDAINTLNNSQNNKNEITLYKALSFYEIQKFDEALKKFNYLVDHEENERSIAKSYYYKGLILNENKKNCEIDESFKRILEKNIKFQLNLKKKMNLKE